MGQKTAAKIRAFREQAGLDEPSPERRKYLAEMKEKAVRLIEYIVLEESGIRGGDGQWHGCDPIAAVICDLSELERKDLEEWKKTRSTYCLS
jgi:hypothetical protein